MGTIFVTIAFTVQLILVSGNVGSPATSYKGPSCGKSYIVSSNSKNEVITYYGGKGTGVPENIDCSWTVEIQQEAFFQLKDFYLTDEDSFAIYDWDANQTDPIFGPFRGRQGSIVIAAVAGNLTLVLKTSPAVFQRAFIIEVQKACTALGDGNIYSMNSVQSGSLRSPIYLASHGGSFTCIMMLSGFGTDKKPYVLSVSITEANISKGKLSLRDRSNKHSTFGGEYDFIQQMPTPMLLTKGMLQMNLTINREVPDQYLVLEFEVVSEQCSKIVNLTSNNRAEDFSLNIANEVVPVSLSCHWMITAPPGSQIHASFHALKFVDTQDYILVSGPIEANFKPLMINSESHQLSQGYLLMPANKMILKFTAARPKNGTLIKFTVSLDDKEKFLEHEGTISLSKSSVKLNGFSMQVGESERLQLTWSSPPPSGTIVSLFTSFNHSATPLMRITPSFQLMSLTLPTHQLRLVVQNMVGPWNLSFKGVPKDTCDQVRSGDVVLFQTSKICERTCPWIVPSLEKHGVFEVSFTKLLLGQSDHVSLYKLNSKVEPFIKFAATKSIPLLQTPASEGLLILIETNCSRDNFAVEALIRFKASCDQSFELSSGQMVEIESPRFPQPYPLNMRCHWRVASPHFLLLRFNQLSLADPSHNLRISASQQTISISQSYYNGLFNLLPDDELLSAPISLSFQTPIVAASVPLGSGFMLTALAFECGGVHSSLEGSLSVFPNAHLCVWSVSVPWKRNFTRTHLRIQLVEGKSTTVKVYDGKSIRNKPLSWNANGTAHSTGPSVMVVYQSNEPVPKEPVLQYFTDYCQSSNMCETGQCMQPWWRCNGINECGDYSDELLCHIITVPNSNQTTNSDRHSSTIPSIDLDFPSPTYGITPDKTQRPSSRVSTSVSSSDVVFNSIPTRDISGEPKQSTMTTRDNFSKEESNMYTPESNYGAQPSISAEGVSHTTLIASVIGALIFGAALGWLVTFLVFRQAKLGNNPPELLLTSL